MSVAFNAVSERLERTTNLVAPASDYSCMFWYKNNNTPAASKYKTCYTIRETAYADWIWIGSDINNNSYFLSVSDGGAPVGTTGVVLAVGDWYLFYYVRSGTNHTLYINGVNQGSVTKDTSGNSNDRMMVGSDDDGGGLCTSDVEVAYFREWSAALTFDELLVEGASPTAVRTANLISSTPLQANGNDDSGAGNNWTSFLTPTFTNNVPIQNSYTPAGAIVIDSLPYNATQDVVDGNGVTQDVWYKYVAQVGDIEIGAWFFGDLTTYKPYTEVKSPDPSTAWMVTEVNGIDNNKRIQFPVTAGESYYFKVRTNGPSVSPAILTVNVLRAPFAPHQVGDIFITPDNSTPSPAGIVMIPGVDYGTRRFVRTFSYSEAADIVANGNILTQIVGSHNIALWDKDFNLLSTISPGVTSSQNPIIRVNRATDSFFWSRWNTAGTQFTIKKYDADGNLISTWGPISDSISGHAGASKNDESIWYYTQVSVSGSAVKTYTFSGGAIAGFIAAVSGYAINDILVLPNDDLLVIYSKGGGSPDVYVKRFDSSGALQATYNSFTDYDGSETHLAYDATDSGHFWIRYNINTPTLGFSRVEKIRVSDGAVITTAVYVNFDQGVYGNTSVAATDTPVTEFGPIVSCPLLILRASSGLGTIIVEKVTIPSDSTDFDVNAGGGLSPSSYTLHDGETQNHTDVTPGSGYSITEDANALYDTVITVSNGSPNTNITVAAGETVTVTIVNTLKSVANAKIFVLKMTDPLNTAFAFSFTGVGVTPTSWILYSEGVIEFNVAPGTYSIIEQAYAQFKTTYMIDNDPLNDNLNVVVGANEEVSVGVLNEAFGGGLFFPNPTFPGAPYPPGTGQPWDKVPDQNAGTVNTQIPTPFAETGFVRDI